MVRFGTKRVETSPPFSISSTFFLNYQRQIILVRSNEALRTVELINRILSDIAHANLKCGHKISRSIYVWNGLFMFSNSSTETAFKYAILGGIRSIAVLSYTFKI